MYEKGGESIP